VTGCQGADCRDRIIAGWLFAVLAMVIVMVILGGVTRLTHSGLSMVDWRPVSGWLPPIGDAEWRAVFAEYRKFPEYEQVNRGMTLSEFKSIFWLEYLHRLWGRTIGIAFALPMILFVVKGWVDRRLASKLVVLFVLGGLQGVLGWYMVKSGLVDRPDVSQYRLTAHFTAALVIIGALQWVAMGLWRGAADAGGVSAGFRRFAVVLFVLITLTAVSGGFVAGLDAGFHYNTFPLMNGELIPEDLFPLSPLYLNFFEDITTVQFDHRILAETVFALVMVFWVWVLKSDLEPARTLPVNALGVAALVQVSLGILTLLLAVPVAIASAHQAGAVALFMAALWVVHAAFWHRRA